MSDYQFLMEEAFLAHKNFKDEWKNWRNGKIKRNKGNLEPESVRKTRDNFFQKSDILYAKLSPLEIKFRENPQLAIDELIKFLSVDITAFRCGYAKEFFLQKLKNVDLSDSQVKQLQRLALQYCQTDTVRREFRRWCRLMIKLADAEFVAELKNIRNSKDLFVRLKTNWMLDLIQKQRTHLK